MLLGFSLLGSVILLVLVLRISSANKEQKRGWKIIRSDRDGHEYSERYDGAWRSIQIDGEMYAKGTPRHAIYLPSDWSTFPEWAQDRKEIIISRIKSELREPTFTIVESD